VPHRGFQPTSVHSPSEAVDRIVRLLYREEVPASARYFKDTIQKDRNQEIRRRYTEGESVPSLALAFGISQQRVHQILQGKRK
jgi:hypothetical protein